MQVHLLELVVVTARTYAAPVGGSSQVLGGQVDDELLVFQYNVVRVAFLADGDVTHGRVGANGARPTDGDDIVVFLAVTAGDHHGGQRVNQRSGFEGNLHYAILRWCKNKTFSWSKNNNYIFYTFFLL